MFPTTAPRSVGRASFRTLAIASIETIEPGLSCTHAVNGISCVREEAGMPSHHHADVDTRQGAVIQVRARESLRSKLGEDFK